MLIGNFYSFQQERKQYFYTEFVNLEPYGILSYKNALQGKMNKLTLKQNKKLGQTDLLPWIVLATGCWEGH